MSYVRYRANTDSTQINVNLTADDALGLARVLAGLAALIDPDDPDGLLDLHAADSGELRGLLLTSAQLALLDRTARIREVERDSFARQLRRIAATIDGQVRRRV